MSAPGSRERRALKRLSAAGMAALPSPGDPAVYGVFPHGDRRRRPVARLDRTSVEQLLSSGALARAVDGDAVVLTEDGRALVKRSDYGTEGFRAQHMDLAAAPVTKPTEYGASPASRVVNLTESPLGWLARRTDGKGEALISTRELL